VLKDTCDFERSDWQNLLLCGIMRRNKLNLTQRLVNVVIIMVVCLLRGLDLCWLVTVCHPVSQIGCTWLEGDGRRAVTEIFVSKRADRMMGKVVCGAPEFGVLTDCCWE
jgi:hypothetical protein